MLYRLVCSNKTSYNKSLQKKLEIIQGSECVYIILGNAKSLPLNVVFISGRFVDLQLYSYFLFFTPFLHPFSDFRETVFCSLLVIISSSSSAFVCFLFHYFLFNFANPRKYVSNNVSNFLKVTFFKFR